MLEHRLTVLEGERLLRVVQTLIGDLIGGRLPGLLRVSATEGAVGQHKLPFGTGADDLEDHPPRPRIIGQVGLHAVAQAGAVASFGLARAKLTGGDPVALHAGSRLTRDMASGDGAVPKVLAEGQLVEKDAVDPAASL